MALSGVEQTTAAVPSKGGLPRIQAELDECLKRIWIVANEVEKAANLLYGTRESEEDKASKPPVADTIDARLSDVRRAISVLEVQASRLNNS